MSQNISTIIGISALLLWSTIIGFLRISTENFGPIYSVTYVYTISAIILLFTYGLPKINHLSKNFIIISSLLFVIFELCFALSITLSNSSEKSIEMNIIFNMWPTLIIIMMAIMKYEKINSITILGICISFIGIILINYHPDLDFIDNFSNNPTSYILIILASILWAIYCIYTKRKSNGVNGISLYFLLTAITLWIITITNYGFNLPSNNNINSYLIILVNSLFFSLGYLAWNVGIIKGNMSILIVVSYFSPIMSSIFSAYILNSELSNKFWYGALTVTIGSLICWYSIKKNNMNYKKSIASI